jgi:hypothetical protein
MCNYFTAISISELQQWLVDDVLPILTERIFYSRAPLNSESSNFDLEGLFKILPPFALDDPAGILIVEVRGPDNWGVDEYPKIRNIKLSGVKRFIPLTEDAKSALAVTWTSIIKLSEALFEKKFVHFMLQNKKIFTLKAGHLFSNLFIKYRADNFLGDGYISDSLPRAIMAAEHRKPNEIEEILGKKVGDLQETWMECVFGYTRHNPFTVKTDLKSFADVGYIMKNKFAEKEKHKLVIQLSDAIKRLNKANDLSLTSICGDSQLAQLNTCFYIAQDHDKNISLVTLSLFLRWKQAFHDERSTVNVYAILGDVVNLSGSVDVEVVAIALWMFGAYLGMENIAPTYRYLHQDKYPALVFSSTKDDFKPVDAWQMEKRVPSTNQKYSPNSIQGDTMIKRGDSLAAPRTQELETQQIENSSLEMRANNRNDVPDVTNQNTEVVASEKSDLEAHKKRQPKVGEKDGKRELTEKMSDTNSVESESTAIGTTQGDHKTDVDTAIESVVPSIAQNLEANQSPSEEETIENLDEEATKACEEVSEAHLSQVDRNKLKLGDLVEFKDNKRQKQSGEITKLNPIKAKINTKNGELMSVRYSSLIKVIDREGSQNKDAGPVKREVATAPIQQGVKTDNSLLSQFGYRKD